MRTRHHDDGNVTRGAAAASLPAPGPLLAASQRSARRPIGSLTAPLALVAALLVPGSAAAVMIDFEAAGFTPGESVDNHQPDGTEAAPPITNVNKSPQAFFIPRARTATPPPDEEIVDLSGSANAADAAHGKVWRISNGTDTGRLGAGPQTPHFGGVAGETGALNDAGRGAPTTDTFLAKLDFRSATGLPQAGLGMAVNGASFDQRHAFIRILDDGGAGLDLEFFDTVGDAFSSTVFDLDLSRDEWHSLAIETIFIDGFASGGFGDTNAIGNDIVNIYLNGALLHTGTSWESFYASVQGHAESIDSLHIQRSGDTGGTTGIPAHLGGGLYFDNIMITNDRFAAAVPAPATAILLVTGLAGCALRRRRKPAVRSAFE